MLKETPNGLAEILQVFGDYSRPNFEKDCIVMFNLPYPLLYDSKPVTRSRCHKLIVDNFVAVFEEIEKQGLQDQVKNYGGIYQPRTKRGLTKPSSHSWGIAIDLEPQKFPLGSKDRFSDEVIAIFKQFGFFYGGDFNHRLDPMHFQFCVGY